MGSGPGVSTCKTEEAVPFQGPSCTFHQRQACWLWHLPACARPPGTAAEQRRQARPAPSVSPQASRTRAVSLLGLSRGHPSLDRLDTCLLAGGGLSPAVREASPVPTKTPLRLRLGLGPPGRSPEATLGRVRLASRCFPRTSPGCWLLAAGWWVVGGPSGSPLSQHLEGAASCTPWRTLGTCAWWCACSVGQQGSNKAADTTGMLCAWPGPGGGFEVPGRKDGATAQAPSHSVPREGALSARRGSASIVEAEQEDTDSRGRGAWTAPSTQLAGPVARSQAVPGEGRALPGLPPALGWGWGGSWARPGQGRGL